MISNPHRWRSLRVRTSVREELLDHARSEAPNECCGLLVGSEGLIERAFRARNLSASPTRYLIDPMDHFAAIRAARTDGRTVLGGYHSHPASPPVPSGTDLAESVGWDFVYLIVSLAEAESMRAYRLAQGGFEALELEIVP